MAATEVVSGVSGESEEKIRDLFQTAMVSITLVIRVDNFGRFPVADPIENCFVIELMMVIYF